MFFVKGISVVTPLKTLQVGSQPSGIVHSPYDQHAEYRTDYRLDALSIKEIIMDVMAKNGYNDIEVERWLNIAFYESTNNSRAIGYASNSSLQFLGLFQIAYPNTWFYNNCTGDPFVPRDNAECAVKVQRSGGWYQWEVVPKHNL